MPDKADHIAWAAEAIAVFQQHCRTGDEHAIADLVCDLGHLAEERGFDFISEVRRGIGHWYAAMRDARSKDKSSFVQKMEFGMRSASLVPRSLSVCANSDPRRGSKNQPFCR